MLRFDLTGALPPGAVIISAQLELFVDQTSASQPTNATVHRVTAPWLEGSAVAPSGGGSGAPSVTGESTWIHRNYPNGLWANAGGDFVAAPSFAFSLPLSGQTISDPSPGLIADLESWLANPASNHGWLIKTDESEASTARRCWSREAASGQPSLTITYLTPGEVAQYGPPCAVSSC